MFVLNEDNSIYATRGDIVFFSVSAEEDGKPYKFQAGDVVRIKVYGKKNAENVVLQKDFPVTDVCEKVEIFLSEEDTKIGEVISKPTDYWYEVELNPNSNPQTIIGYDEDGAKVLKLFPEGDDIPEFVPDPEDVRVIDTELDMTSTRPVQNQAIAREMVSLRADFEETEKNMEACAYGAETAATRAERAISVERARIDELVSGDTADGAEVVDIRVGADGVTYDSAGTAVRTQISNMKNHADLASGGDVVAISPTAEQIIDGSLITADGKQLASASWLCTDFIEIHFVPLFKVNVSCTILGSASLVFYDKDKRVILGINGSSLGNYGYLPSDYKQTFALTLPDGAAYVRMCGCKSYFEYDSPDAFVIKGSVNKWCDSVNELREKYSESEQTLVDVENRLDSVSATLKGKKVLVLGDSISADAYGSYAKWVTMLIEDGFFPSDTVNSSQHATGFVARYNNLENDFISRIESVEDCDTYDFVVVFGGINDYIRSIPLGESGGDILTAFVPAVDHFFSYLVSNFINARIVVFTPLHTSAWWENSAGNMQEVYSDYIKSVAKKYHLPILNLSDESGFHPEVSAFRERWTLLPEGYDLTDGVHPTEEYQRRFLMPMIKGFLRNLL